jgi:hypothetical protein
MLYNPHVAQQLQSSSLLQDPEKYNGTEKRLLHNHDPMLAYK